MSIQGQIERISGNITETYSAVEEKGGTLPDVQNSGNLAAAVRSIRSGDLYSAEETLVGTWTDGKPLYRRVFTGVSGSLNELHSLGQISNIDTGVSVRGVIWRSDIQGVTGIPSGSVEAGITGDGRIAVVAYSAAAVNAGVMVIAEYTKTTD